MSPVRATVLQLSLDLQLRTLQLSRYARSKRRQYSSCSEFEYVEAPPHIDLYIYLAARSTKRSRSGTVPTARRGVGPLAVAMPNAVDVHSSTRNVRRSLVGNADYGRQQGQHAEYAPLRDASGSPATPAYSSSAAEDDDAALQLQLTATKDRERKMEVELAQLKSQLQSLAESAPTPQAPRQPTRTQAQSKAANGGAAQPEKPKPEPEPEPDRREAEQKAAPASTKSPKKSPKREAAAAVQRTTQARAAKADDSDDEEEPLWRRRFARRDQADRELTSQLDELTLELKQAETSEEYTDALRLHAEIERLRNIDLDEMSNIAEILGDDHQDEDLDAPPGSARRCLKRLWNGLPRVEQIEVNALRIKDLEQESLYLREDMLELGAKKLYTGAAAKKRQLLLRKDQIETLKAKNHTLEMATKIDAYKRQEAKKLRDSLKSHRSGDAAGGPPGVLSQMQQKQREKAMTQDKLDPEQQTLYKHAFSAALKKLPVRICGGKTVQYGDNSLKELIAKHDGFEVDEIDMTTETPASKQSKWDNIRHSVRHLPTGCDMMVDFKEGDDRHENAEKFVHDLNKAHVSGALERITCIYSPADNDDTVNKDQFIILMRQLDPSLFRRAQLKGQSAEDTIAQLLREVDKDSSGNVSWLEFSMAVQHFGRDADLLDGVKMLFQVPKNDGFCTAVNSGFLH